MIKLLDILNESYNPNIYQVECTVAITAGNRPIPEVLSDIRAIPGVTVVDTIDSDYNTEEGRHLVKLSIKIDPSPFNPFDSSSYDKILSDIKKLPDIRGAKFTSNPIITEGKLHKLIKEVLQEKADRCKRIADRKYDKPSAYKSGAIVRCRKGDIWKDLKEVVLSSLVNIDPYNNPDDEYAQDLDSYLEDDNIDWKKESYITLINPNQIQPSEWNSLSNDPKNSKSIKYSKVDPSKFPPILALKTGPNSYEAIDGIHRVYAFRLNNHMIPAIVITPKLEQGLSTSDTQMVNFMYNKYKDSNIPTPTKINNLKEENIPVQSPTEKIDQLPQGKLFDDAKNIEGIFTKSSRTWSEVAEAFERGRDEAEQELLGIEDIHITQPNVQANKVKSMLDRIESLPTINVVEFEDGEKVIYDAHHRLTANWALGNDKIKVNLVKVNNLQEAESLRTWFKRKGAPGKEGGWVDCNTCRKVNGKTKCKSCGRKKGEKRAKYPSCRPTATQCKQPGKGKKWGKTK